MDDSGSGPEKQDIRWIGFVVAAILAVGWLLGPDPRLLGVDWQGTSVLPFPVTDDLEMARAGWFPKRSSLRLVCGPSGARLLLRSNLPVPVDQDWLGARGKATIYIGGINHKMELRSRLVGYGLVETIVTQHLAAHEVANVSTWLERPGDGKVSFMVHETGTYMRPAASGSDVRAFASGCVSRRAEGHPFPAA